ncbi:MAG: SIMPL domain-containing protein [Patescibacteria group bacterium]
MNEFMGNRAMRVSLIAVAVMLTLFLLVTTWNAAFGRKANDPYNTITVSGTGTSAMVPDIAKIQFTVTESAATVADAQKAATDKTDAAIKGMKDQGIDDKDVKTVYYNVAPKYEYMNPCRPGMMCPAVVSGNPKIVGYEVSQSIEVKVRDTAKAGDVLQTLGTLGVQNISGPNFTVDDDADVKSKAREEAIAQAREKAKVLAKQLGVHLGKVVNFSEGGDMYPMYEGFKGGVAMDAAVSAAPSLPTGENETNVTVQITYEIR